MLAVVAQEMARQLGYSKSKQTISITPVPHSGFNFLSKLCSPHPFGCSHTPLIGILVVRALGIYCARHPINDIALLGEDFSLYLRIKMR